MVYMLHLPSGSWRTLALVILGLTVAFGAYKLFLLLVRPLFSPLRDLPGPASPSLLFGHFRKIFEVEPGELHGKWVDEYGTTFVYKGMFNRDRIFTLDTKALQHVLNHSYDWQKPEEVRNSLAQILGEGVLFAEGDSHKRQRRVMNPSFSLSHLRELTGIFLEKSAQLRNVWLAQSVENGGSYRTDVLSWLEKAALDIIGLAGFDYEFNALNPSGEENELYKAFMTVPKQRARFTFLGVLTTLVPIFRAIPTQRTRNVATAMKVMNHIGLKLVSDKKRAMLAMADSKDDKDSLGNQQIAKSSITTRDLLSRLMVANMATDLPENQRLSDEDVFAQVPTFLVAGHETTATATAWCLYALSRDLDVQTRLRNELLGLGTSTPSMNELNALPYLDGVIRETLRLHAVVTSTVRIATKDDVVPFGTPFKDRKGQSRHEIRVNKGDTMFIPILTMNTDKGFWGDDAQEFRPERWQHISEKAKDIPGVHRGLMSFLGGPRACIGYRFALAEFKCLIFTLVTAFSFEMADPSHEILKKSNVVTRPVVKSEADKGNQLPLRVTPWRAA